MFESSVTVSQPSAPFRDYRDDLRVATNEPSIRPIDHDAAHGKAGVLHGFARRWRRERRRRKVGRAYDMALEIARALHRRSPGSRLLDVGCGNGYIAHHLSGILDAQVMGIDLDQSTEARIDYRPFDGAHFPVETGSLDAVLFCYVLHHAQDLAVLMSELRRVLCDSGQVVVYEDIPERWWDRLVCRSHDRKWRGRTGPCSFQSENEWRNTFEAAGFQITSARTLSRWRNLAHPVSRRIFVLELDKEKLDCRGGTPWPPLFSRASNA